MGKITEAIKKLQDQKEVNKDEDGEKEEVVTKEDKEKEEDSSGPKAEKSKEKKIKKSLDDYVCEQIGKK